MATNGVAIATVAAKQAKTLRRQLRDLHSTLAELADGEHCGAIVLDADELDEETSEGIVSLVEAACAAHPHRRIEVTVVALSGTDNQEAA